MFSESIPVCTNPVGKGLSQSEGWKKSVLPWSVNNVQERDYSKWKLWVIPTKLSFFIAFYCLILDVEKLMCNFQVSLDCQFSQYPVLRYVKFEHKYFLLPYTPIWSKSNKNTKTFSKKNIHTITVSKQRKLWIYRTDWKEQKMAEDRRTAGVFLLRNYIHCTHVDDAWWICKTLRYIP